jgi:hypothetical protein
MVAEALPEAVLEGRAPARRRSSLSRRGRRGKAAAASPQDADDDALDIELLHRFEVRIVPVFGLEIDAPVFLDERLSVFSPSISAATMSPGRASFCSRTTMSPEKMPASIMLSPRTRTAKARPGLEMPSVVGMKRSVSGASLPSN